MPKKSVAKRAIKVIIGRCSGLSIESMIKSEIKISRDFLDHLSAINERETVDSLDHRYADDES